MTTIKISVKNKRDATLLLRVLKKMPFIDCVEETNREIVPNQFNRLSEFLTKHRNTSFFSTEPDAVLWQKKLRDEWE